MAEIIALCVAVAFNVWFFIGYLGNGNAFPKPLTAEEEEEYIKKMHEGDEKARQILIERNLRLVAHVAKKYTNPGMETDDLISIGTIGLIKGVTSYNGGKGTRLATYVARCIENEILMSIRSSKKIRKEVSVNEIIGTDKEGNNITLMDVIEDDDKLIEDKVETKLQISRLYAKMKEVLDPREIEILTWRYGLNNREERSQHVIAKSLGISRSYVSRIEKKALQKLKEIM